MTHYDPVQDFCRRFNVRLDLTVPDMTFGEWTVRTIEVTPDQAKLNAVIDLFNGSGHRSVPAGTYRQLLHRHKIIMSNTPAELKDTLPLVAHAKGQVLINGLGLGITVELIIDQIDCVTVVEKDPDIVRVIGQHYLTKYPEKFVIIEADSLTFKPQGKYDAVWHDIWPTISSDNLKEMAILNRKYARRTRWQAAWCQEECKWMRRVERGR